jgi:mannitol-1-phosphate 5-dehydrogenase
VFAEKDDLLPFEEAKLYGHNAIHALLAYLGALRGYEQMTELAGDAEVMGIARKAFLEESGGALIRKYAGLGDRLFTEQGYREFAEDLLVRMTNPYLSDAIARAGRDPVRKLGYGDRIYGTMVQALEQGIEPEYMARGAAAGVLYLLEHGQENQVPAELNRLRGRELGREDVEQVLSWIWGSDAREYAERLIELTVCGLDALQKV